MWSICLYSKNWNGLLKDFRGMKKETQVCWRAFDAICVCPLIDYGQQPMKMHTEVTLLYKYVYRMYEATCIHTKQYLA